MKKFCLIALCLAATPVALQAAPDTLPAWITGAWELKGEGVWGDEFWTPPRGGIMIGAGRVGKGDQLISFESMRIGYDEDGKLAFWATPQWSEVTKFSLQSRSETEVVFTNPAHDFPQKVRYWREGKELRAEISLLDGSKKMQFSFTSMGGKN